MLRPDPVYRLQSVRYVAALFRRLAQCLFCMQVLSNQEAWAHYSKLLKDLLVVCQLTGIQQWPQLQEFLHSFAKRNPGSVARSAMHAAITGETEPKTGTSWPVLPC